MPGRTLPEDPQREVFIDALMELGVHQVFGEGTYGWYGLRHFEARDSDGGRDFFRSSTLDVVLYRVSFEVKWVYRVFSGMGHGIAVHTFLFPSEWDYALAHVRQVIRLAEHKLETGETREIVRETR